MAVAENAVKAAPAGLERASLAEGLRAGAELSIQAAAKGMMMWQKVISATAIVAVVGTAWYAARLNGEIQALRAEDVALREQLAQTQRDLDEAKSRLAMRQGQSDDAEKNVRELARLRAEVARLRDATKAAALAPKETTKAPAEAQQVQILTEAKFVEVPNNKIDSLGITWMDDGQGARHSLLTSNQVVQMRQAFDDNHMDVLSTPRTVTLNGVPASLSATTAVQLNDTNVNVGPGVTILANFSTNDATFTLDVTAKMDELAGDPTQVFELVLTNEAILPRGQTFVLAREMPTNSRAAGHMESPAVPSTLVVAVTPELIDPAGDILPYQ